MVPVPPTPRPVQVLWPANVDLPPTQLANVFALNVTEDGLIIVIGQANLPLFNGDEATTAQQFAQLESIEAQPLARYVVPMPKALQLSSQLQMIMGIAMAQQLAAQQLAGATGANDSEDAD